MISFPIIKFEEGVAENVTVICCSYSDSSSRAYGNVASLGATLANVALARRHNIPQELMTASKVKPADRCVVTLGGIVKIDADRARSSSRRSPIVLDPRPEVRHHFVSSQRHMDVCRENARGGRP